MVEQKNSYAGFWLRLVAWIIDMLVVMGASILLGSFLGIVAPNIDLFDSQVVWDVIGFATVWLYFTVMESSSKQGTLGKMALGIFVTDMDGNRISFARANGRDLGKILSELILGFGYVMIAFTEKKQALHDKLAGCLVLKKQK